MNEEVKKVDLIAEEESDSNSSSRETYESAGSWTSDENKQDETGSDSEEENNFYKEYYNDNNTEGTTNVEKRKFEPRCISPSLEETQKFKNEGNTLFMSKQYQAAVDAYSKALLYCPEDQDSLLSVIFSNKAACHLSLSEFDAAVSDSMESIELNNTYPKAYLRRYRAYLGLKKYHEALADLKKAIELSPDLAAEYQKELATVEKLSADQFEIEKNEMIDKLKGFGNWALGKVGLSLDNFKMEQNAQGSYNITFNQ